MALTQPSLSRFCEAALLARLSENNRYDIRKEIQNHTLTEGTELIWMHGSCFWRKAVLDLQ
jgi:hypothetical protein